MKDPCGNERCIKCYPFPTWRISQHRVQHITYEREIKAATLEDAMKEFHRGTAWPSSYDDRGGEIISQDEPIAEQLPSEADRTAGFDPEVIQLTYGCWHDMYPDQEQKAVLDE